MEKTVTPRTRQFTLGAVFFYTTLTAATLGLLIAIEVEWHLAPFTVAFPLLLALTARWSGTGVAVLSGSVLGIVAFALQIALVLRKDEQYLVLSVPAFVFQDRYASVLGKAWEDVPWLLVCLAYWVLVGALGGAACQGIKRRVQQGRQPLGDLCPRRGLQCSLRTLVLVMLLISIGMSWIVAKLAQATRETKAMISVSLMDGWAHHEYGLVDGRFAPGRQPPEPQWVRDLLGVRSLSHVAAVHLGAGFEHANPLSRESDSGLVVLRDFPRLQRLELGGPRFTDEGIVHLQELKRLEHLELRCTKITDAGLEQLKGLTRLRTLELYGTQVSDAGLEHLAHWPHLQRLGLRGTQVTDDGVKKLQEALPTCRIER